MRSFLPILFAATISCGSADTDSDSANADLRAFVDAYYDVYLRDGVTVEQMLQYYAEDVEFVDPTFQIEVHGHEGLRQLYGTIGTPEFNYRELEWQLDAVLSEGNQVAINGTWKGMWHNCPFEIPFVTILDIEDGLIARQQDFFAASMFDNQVDLDRETGLPACETSTAGQGQS